MEDKLFGGREEFAYFRHTQAKMQHFDATLRERKPDYDFKDDEMLAEMPTWHWWCHTASAVSTDRSSLSDEDCNEQKFLTNWELQESQAPPPLSTLSCIKENERMLHKFHPQWDFTNDEIKASTDLLKRDCTPICFPPSWDLVQRYAGATAKEADGFNEKVFSKRRFLFSGDQSNAKFLKAIQRSKLGGVLVGDISSWDLATEVKEKDQALRSQSILQKMTEMAKAAMNEKRGDSNDLALRLVK
jgi:hypothetical protein